MSQVNNNQRFAFIDGLRGLAALWVVLFHFNVAIQKHASFQFPYYLEKLFSNGYLGIHVFFVLSGFVIAYNLREVKMDFKAFFHFFVKRSLRLDPPYWMVMGFTLTLAIIASATFKSWANFPFTSSQIFYNLLYLPDLMQVPLLVPVAWTLCIEFQFYLFFALLIMMHQWMNVKSSFFHFFWISLSLFSLLQNTSLAIVPLKPTTFIPYWYSFFLGCSACWTIFGKMHPIYFWFNLVLILLGCFWIGTPHAFAAVVTSLTIYFVFLGGGANHVLKQSAFQYMGKISYSLYLIHWPIGMKLVDFAYKMREENISAFFLLTVTLFLTILGRSILSFGGET